MMPPRCRRRNSRHGESGYSTAMLAALVPFLLAVQPAASAGWHIVATKSFDAKQATFYWEGARISSPATFTTDGKALKVNGVAALDTIPSDTAGVSARVAAVFAGVPLVDSLVAQGASYVSAVDEYGCVMGRRLRRALAPSLGAVRAGGDAQGTPQLMAIAEEMRIPRNAVRVRGHVLECVVDGGARLSVSLDAPDSVVLGDPCAPPTPEARRATIEKRVADTVAALGGDGPLLVVADASRTATFSGASFATATDQIRQAVVAYQKGGALAVRNLSKDFLLPAHVLIKIGRRASTTGGR